MFYTFWMDLKFHSKPEIYLGHMMEKKKAFILLQYNHKILLRKDVERECGGERRGTQSPSCLTYAKHEQ